MAFRFTDLVEEVEAYDEGFRTDLNRTQVNKLVRATLKSLAKRHMSEVGGVLKPYEEE